MASSSESPDGCLNRSSNACFSASASASCRACLDASSASASASFFMKSLALGSSSSGLIAMFDPIPHRKINVCVAVDHNVSLGAGGMLYLYNERPVVGSFNKSNHIGRYVMTAKPTD